jgi:cellulose synthase/poly-beta-1,6-N-acetylglucosamine synthase-like glycosyltransferase
MRVNEKLPSVTVLIAARPGQAEIKAVTAGRLLDYPRGKLDILVARGRHPSVQRNAALRAARGDLIYFLDDDSVPPPGNLLHAAPAFADPKVQMFGGPNLCPPEAPLLEQVFALVHASWLAFGPSRARYAAVGAVRESGEKELILCNLLARRETMLELGGFNEALYPNEENALMDEIQKRGGKLIYDPSLIVHRRPRRSLRSFAKMLWNYGRGRAEQFRLHPTPGSAVNFVPPLFCVYLLMLAAAGAYGPHNIIWPLLIPLVAYITALLAQAAFLAVRGGVFRSLCAIPLIFLTHLIYGIGFWRGLFTSLRKSDDGRPKTTVELENVEMG